MKKLFILAVLFSSACVTINAQNISSNCYRGFVDAGYAIGQGDYDFGRIEVNTSHGYQFNPHIFLGAGVGFHFASSYKTSDEDIALDIRDSKVDVPVFADVRYNVLKKKVSPYIDLKGGTYVNNNGGLYVNLSAGCRIATNAKQAVNISVGYASEKLEFETFEDFINYSSLKYTRKATKYDTESIVLKVGYEF
jgi:hypothetical protein